MRMREIWAEKEDEDQRNKERKIDRSIESQTNRK